MCSASNKSIIYQSFNYLHLVGLDAKQMIVIDIATQQLYFLNKQTVQLCYKISSAKLGLGNCQDSYQTPLGLHKIADKIGEGLPKGAIFKARQYHQKQAKIYTDDTLLAEDSILTRILWLKGLEPNINQGEGVDSYRRYIYIHGTAEEGYIGSPVSHGCIRMKNDDIMTLFNQVPVGTYVLIQASIK